MPSKKSIQLTVLALLIGLAGLLSIKASAYAQTTPGPEQLQEGANLFAENCAMCHGANGEGRIGATLAQDWPSIRPDLTVRTIIENGVEGSVMPAWSEKNGGPLSDEQITSIVDYILSWQTGGALPLPQVTPPAAVQATAPPGVEGDPGRGANLFAVNCAVCHGQNGEGRVGATLAKTWSGIRPDLSIRSTIENGVEGSAMPAWSQANGGPLSETDVNDLVSYIMTWDSSSAGAVTQPVQEAEPPARSLLAGIGALAFGAVLLAAIIAGALYFQRKR